MTTLRNLIYAVGALAAISLALLLINAVGLAGVVRTAVTLVFWVSFVALVVALFFYHRDDRGAEEIVAEGPPFARFLFNNRVAGWVWLPIRLFLGIAWLDSVKIRGIKVVDLEAKGTPKDKDRTVVKDTNAKPMWARFYEIETNRPIFCGRDGVKKYSLAEIEYERRNGYSWLGYYAEKLLAEDYPAWKAKTGGIAR